MRRMMLLAVMVSLGGCSTMRPQLYSMPALTKATQSADVAVILDKALAIQDSYKAGYDTSAKFADFSSLPVIGAAAAVAALVFDGGKHQRKRVGFIGIGVGAYTAARSVISPPGTPDLFVRGHAALGCIRAEGPMFVGTGADAKWTALGAAGGNLETILAFAAGYYGAAQIQGSITGDDAKRYAAATKALADAMTAAEAARDIAARESAAFGGAANFFGAAVSDVTVRVATKGREGRSVDYDALKAQLIAGAPAVVPADPANAPVPLGAVGTQASYPVVGLQDTPAKVMEKLYIYAVLLNGATRGLTAATPKYTESLNRVQTCPAKV